MADEPAPDDLDRALHTAVRRTADVQAHVDEVVDAGLIPPTPVVDDVVRRADDIRQLAAAIDRGDSEPDRPEPEDGAA